MHEIILCKLGEVVLKGLNRRSFEMKLMSNIRRRTQRFGKWKIYSRQSTIYVEPAEESEETTTQAAKSRAANGGGTVQINTGARASAELDIRGLETLEAESVVENYLDAAQRSKLGSVTIIHGKGTGALRAAVHQMLKKNRAVKSFRLGRYGEGEAGVTVVELK